MIWTILSFGTIVLWVAGMIVAAKLAEKSGGKSREPDLLGNCRRGAVRLAGRIKPALGLTLVTKRPS